MRSLHGAREAMLQSVDEDAQLRSPGVQLTHHSWQSRESTAGTTETTAAKKSAMLRLVLYLTAHCCGFILNVMVLALFAFHKQYFWFGSLLFVKACIGLFCAWAAFNEKPELHRSLPSVLRVPLLAILYGLLQFIQVHHIFDLYRRRARPSRLVHSTAVDRTTVSGSQLQSFPGSDADSCCEETAAALVSRLRRDKDGLFEALLSLQQSLQRGAVASEASDQIRQARTAMTTVRHSLSDLQAAVVGARSQRRFNSNPSLVSSLDTAIMRACELVDDRRLKAGVKDVVAVANGVVKDRCWHSIDDYARQWAQEIAEGTDQPRRRAPVRLSSSVSSFHSKTFDGILEGLFFGFISLYAFFLMEGDPLPCAWHILHGQGDFKEFQEERYIFLVSALFSMLSTALGTVEVDYRVNTAVRDRIETSNVGAAMHLVYRFSEVMYIVFLMVCFCLLSRPLMGNFFGTFIIVMPYGVLWLAYICVFAMAKPLGSPQESVYAHFFVAMATIIANVCLLVDKPGYVAVVKQVNKWVITVRVLKILSIPTLILINLCLKSKMCDTQWGVWEYVWRFEKAAFLAFVGVLVLHGVIFFSDSKIRGAFISIETSKDIDEAVIEMIPDRNSRHPEAVTTRQGVARGLSSHLLQVGMGVTSKLFSREVEQLADFVIERELGKGAYSVVVLAKQRAIGGEPLSSEDQLRYAMKFQNTESRRFHAGGQILSSKETMANRERDLLLKLQHPFIVRLIYYFEVPERKFKDSSKGEVVRDITGNDRFHKAIVMEFCPEGDLDHYVFRHAVPMTHRFPGGSVLPHEGFEWFMRMRRFCAEMAVALRFLHERSITFRDLKPQNVLLKAGNDEQLHICLTDFGFSKQFTEEHSQLQSLAGTHMYAAPEVLKIMETQQRMHYTPAVDLFSLGRTLLVILWRAKYSEDPPELRFPSPKEYQGNQGNDLRVPDIALRCVHKLTSEDPKLRGESRELGAEPFFNQFEHCGRVLPSIDWSALVNACV